MFDQIEVLDTFCKLLYDTDGDCHTILSGDFNVIFDTILDASGGKPSLKKKTIAKLISITEMLDTCDAFRIRHSNLQRFTFRRKKPSLQRRLDYIFLANNMQECISNIEFLP